MSRLSVLSFALAAASALAVSCAGGWTAHAEPARGNPAAAAVAYADLDLARSSGQQALAARIHAAAHAVCGGEPGMVELDRRGLYRGCVQGAEDRAFIEMQLLIAEATRSSSQPIRIASTEPQR